SRSRRHRALHSFPTRRSSDLRAGFEAVDVHMSDLISGRKVLEGFKGLAACGGFSYGDVLGAGRGWAVSILEHPVLRDQFAAFFADRKSTRLNSSHVKISYAVF